MVKAWLRNVIEIRLHPSISFTGTIAEIWKELKERFSTGNAPRVHQLKSELNSCKQGKGQSIVEYYTQLKAIWDDLSTYSRVPQCTCGDGAELLKEREEEKVHQFLMGLDTNLYGNIRSNLLMKDDITSSSRAYALMLREQRHKAVMKTKEEINEAAMAVKPIGGGGRGNGAGNNANQEQAEYKPPHCDHCDKDYHTEENCWEIHGYPTCVRGRGRGRGRGNHQVANATSTSENETQKQGQQNLTNDEMTTLRSLLNSKNEGRRELLEKVWGSKPSTVGLPNGSNIIANLHGMNQSTRMEIGRGEHKDGVYVMRMSRETVSRVQTSGEVSSLSGAHYFLTIVDDCNRAVWVHLMRDRGEVNGLMKIFFNMTLTQFGKQVKVVQSDNGTECLSGPLKEYYDEHGMDFQTSNDDTPQQNGRVERKHRHILEKARALHFQAELPIEFWGECILTAAYLINRTPSRVINGLTPYEVLYGEKPCFDHIRVFGCLAYAHNKDRPKDKFTERGKRCIFIGYPHSKKG
ncbi:uncharacterized protein LOC141620700 [Silene latifolia]|uniref:uncharacterized protein LOC141620700 n=1 Tax=Silene latifolia TaxID=37657 RepID=UPI003D76F520